jgi:glycerol-3-phosphate dehydrogenase (NAD(P)+)
VAKIVVLGAGVMGTAFTVPMTDTGQEVNLVGTHLDHEIIENIRETGRHPKLKRGIGEAVTTFHDYELEQALGINTDLIVLGVSSPGVQWAIHKLGPVLRRSIPILMLTKGLAVCDGRLTILPRILSAGLAAYGLPQVPVGGVGGPCIAGELVVRRDTSVVMAFEDNNILDMLMPLIATKYYHACPTSDLVGLEVCAALKNMYALAVGYANGLKQREGADDNGVFMYNLASGLFTQALLEIDSFVRYLSGGEESACGLAGAGDLYVTCLAGRNSRMGCLLGRGMRYSEAKEQHMAGETIEGADLALAIGPALMQLQIEGKFDLDVFPLAKTIIDAICNNQLIEIPWKKFYRKDR